MSTIYSFGIGVGSKNQLGEWLEVLFPAPQFQPDPDISAVLMAVLGDRSADIELNKGQVIALESALRTSGDSVIADSLRMLSASDRPLVAVILIGDNPPTTVPQAYLKLQLLSHRLVRPHQTNIDGIFATLKNIAWTNAGPIDIEELPARTVESKLRGQNLSVNCIDKFPKMVDYVVPSGVRIADAARVRLGAYVGAGTTVMHEGFINFNAGTEGPNMVEGRISAGVFCGAGSDIGGGASIMGTLSGGGSMVISLGKECLLGANSGLGIPLGDRCTVEAGLYVTAGTVVTMIDGDGRPGAKRKARELAGKDDLLLRRNSLTGAVECLANKNAVALNEQLHSAN